MSDNSVQPASVASGRQAPSSQRKFKRTMATLVARCAAKSWLVMVATPVVVVVCALA